MRAFFSWQQDSLYWEMNIVNFISVSSIKMKLNAKALMVFLHLISSLSFTVIWETGKYLNITFLFGHCAFTSLDFSSHSLDNWKFWSIFHFLKSHLILAGDFPNTLLFLFLFYLLYFCVDIWQLYFMFQVYVT